MKKHILAGIALLSTILFSCTEKEIPTCNFLGLQDSYSFQADLDQQESFQIDANVSWSIEKTNLDWVEVTPTQGTGGIQTVKIIPLNNTTIFTREGSFTIKSSVVEKTVKVAQLGLAPALTVSPDAGKCTYSGTFIEGGSLSVTANCDWSATSNASWLKLSASNGVSGTATVTLTAEANAKTEARTAEITFIASTVNKKITVTQDAKPEDYVKVKDVTEVKFDAAAAQQTVSVESNGDWTATTKADWITITPNSGNGNKDVKIAVTEYAKNRTAEIKFTCGEANFVLTVKQQGASLSDYAVLNVGDSFKWQITNSAGTQLSTWNSTYSDSNTQVYATGDGLGLMYADNSPEVGGNKIVYMNWVKGSVPFHTGYNKDFDTANGGKGNYFFYGSSNFTHCLAVGNGAYTDDAFVFHMPIVHLDANNTLEAKFAFNATGKQPCFWNAEFSFDEGKTWITGDPTLLTYTTKENGAAVDGSTITNNNGKNYTSANGKAANLNLRDNESKQGKSCFTYSVTCKIPSDVDCVEVLFRIRCVDGLDTVKKNAADDLPAVSGAMSVMNPRAVGETYGTAPVSITLK